MEPNSAREENASFDDLDLDYNLLSQLIHGDTIEACAKEIAGNISNEIGELRMLGASNSPPMDENLAASANANILDATEENIQNLAQPAGSFSSPPSTTIAQIDPPIMQPENQSPVPGNNQPQGLLNSNSSTFGNEEIISTNISDPLVTTATTLLEASFGAAVTGIPKPSSPLRPAPIRNSGNQLHLQRSDNPQEHLEQEILDGTESFPTLENPNDQGSVLSSYSAFDHLAGNSTNAGQTMASSFSSVLPTLSDAYPPTTLGLMQQNNMVHPTFPSRPEVNWMNMNAPNAHSQNSFEIDFVRPQWMAPIFADQSGQNMANKNMTGNSIQQAPVYAAQYPQTIGSGVVDGKTSSWLHQQQPTWLPVNNVSPYRHLRPSGQFMTSSVFNPTNANSMLYRPSMPLRTQNLVNGLPVHNQIPGTSNMCSLLYNHSEALGQPTQQWPHQFTNQNYQDLMMSNVYNPQGFNNSLPGSSSLAVRTPNLSHGTHGMLNFQYPSSPLTGPNSVPSTSMTQQLNRNYQSIERMPSLLNLQTRHSMAHNLSGQLGQVNLMNFGGPIVINPQNNNSIQPVSSMLPGTQMSSAQGRTNRTSTMPGLAAPQPENFVLPGSDSSSSPWQQAHGPQEAPNVTTTNWANPILDSSQESELVNANTNRQDTGNQEEGVMISDQLNPNQERRNKTQQADTSSSSSSKHPKRKRESTTPEDMQNFNFPTNEGTSNVANARKPRWEKNGVYSPSFERVGLHIDPHLRMFSLQ